MVCEFVIGEDCHEDFLVSVTELAHSDMAAVGRAGYFDADIKIFRILVAERL